MGLPVPSLLARSQVCHGYVPPVLAFSPFLTISMGDDGHSVEAPSAFFPANAAPSPPLPEKYCHT